MDRLREASNEAEEVSGRSVFLCGGFGSVGVLAKVWMECRTLHSGGDDFQGLGHSIGGCA